MSKLESLASRSAGSAMEKTTESLACPTCSRLTSYRGPFRLRGLSLCYGCASAVAIACRDGALEWEPTSERVSDAVEHAS